MLILLNWSQKRFGWPSTILALVAGPALMSLYLYYNHYAVLNQLMSERLYYWSEVSIQWYNPGWIDRGAFDSAERFRVDNAYLEYVFDNGILFFPLMLIFWLNIINISKKTYIGDIELWCFIFVFMMYCFLDTGMFSTGNFMDILIWSLIGKASSSADNQKSFVANFRSIWGNGKAAEHSIVRNG